MIDTRCGMQKYIILSHFSSEAFADPKDFKKIAVTVSEKLKVSITAGH